MLFFPGLCCVRNKPERFPPIFGYAVEGFPVTVEQVASLEQSSGIAPGIVSFFLQWPAPDVAFDYSKLEESFRAVRDSGAVPCLTWEPMYLQGSEEHVIHADKILEGIYDGYIRSVAGIIRERGDPVLVRFAHEMNLARYHWGTEGGDYGPESPALYRRMHRYVVEVFREEGASNALWVFCPNAESVPNPDRDRDAAWNTASNYYPGDEWVDVLAMDGYNRGTVKTEAEDGWNSRWQSFREIFRHLRDELLELAPDKPLCVMETASVTQGGDREKWLADATKTAVEWELDAVVWFQVDKEYDWRLTHQDTGLVRDHLIGPGERARNWAKEIADEKN